MEDVEGLRRVADLMERLTKALSQLEERTGRETPESVYSYLSGVIEGLQAGNSSDVYTDVLAKVKNSLLAMEGIDIIEVNIN